MDYRFPQDFLFGVATAATQIEGGDQSHSWQRWSDQGHIKDGSHSRRGCDHWNRLEEDTALLQELGCQTYRMGLEWSRLEPAPGQYDPDALAHYRRELELLHQAGIRPLITLHHFTNPLWFEDQGAWLNPRAPEIFEGFVDYAVGNLGDLCTDWITLNEPNIYLVMGYVRGEWPPGEKDRTDLFFKGARHMIEAHIRAYRKIHSLSAELGRPRPLVGAAHHLRIFDGAGGPGAALSAALHHRVFQGLFVEAMATGRLQLPLGVGRPWGKGPFQDFLGINYYTRDIIRWDWKEAPLFGRITVREGAPVNDLGWEIYPEGLGRLARRLHKRYACPLFITENGICDAEDGKRAEFLKAHLAQVAHLREEGIPLDRYYHWTFVDNFEWIEGEAARFGLVENDFKTQKRSIRPSGQLFRTIAQNRVLELP